MLFMLVVKMEEVDIPVVKVPGETKSRLGKIVVSFARRKVTGQISAQ